jgi:hypothetical protein
MNKQKRFFRLIVAMLVGSLVGALAISAVTTTRSKKIRRTILLNFKPEASPDEIRNILQEVRTNITKLKGVHHVVVGPQINQKAQFGYGISMDFDDEAALRAYRADEEHRQTHNRYVHLIAQAQITDIREP